MLVGETEYFVSHFQINQMKKLGGRSANTQKVKTLMKEEDEQTFRTIKLSDNCSSDVYFYANF